MSIIVSGASKFEVSGDVIHQPVQDEVILLNLKTQQYYGLDDVGSRMWYLLLEHGDLGTVSKRLKREYPGGCERIDADLKSLVDDLVNVGILTITI